MSLLLALAAERAARRAARASAWPEGTILTDADVRVHGASLAEQAGAGTPAVRIGCTDRAHGERWTSLVLTRVTRIERDHRGRPAAIRVDADLRHCLATAEASRLVGRVASARQRRIPVHDADDVRAMALVLPRDLVVGDVLVIPCDGVVTRAELRP